ncbi:hypothetical protein C9374_012851 [Naegleria lovaniensis]|uniref:Uncharacterized protein n=1 Tax=Naegleria lovaniensis TaxID=51637 RepID=A0AA88GCG5_NAELO|nr:uncharacterized protein C9374_012851 [Naegleria lovaniensis]KAG2373119.1 hypothetical protein C9374_012851 [Naegleria lovaniensis]
MSILTRTPNTSRERSLSSLSQNSQNYGSIGSQDDSNVFHSIPVVNDDDNNKQIISHHLNAPINHYAVQSMMDDRRQMSRGSSINNNNEYYVYHSKDNAKNGMKSRNPMVKVLSFFYTLTSNIGIVLTFGSLLRFPYISHKFHGGAFIIPYFLLLAIIGLPLIILDYSLGYISGKNFLFSLARWNRRSSGIGMASCILGSVIISSYYSVITSWLGVYFGNIFSDPMPWSGTPEHFFKSQILKISTNWYDMSGFLSWPVLVALASFWFLSYWFLFLESVSKIVRWFAAVFSSIYVLMLLVILIRVLFEVGSGIGILQFLKPDWMLLAKGDLWLGAFGQICFTYGISNGYLTMYSSQFKNGNKDIVLNSFMILFAGILVSVISGVSYYAVLGYLAVTSKTPDEINSHFHAGIGSPIFVMIEAATNLFPIPHMFTVILIFSLIFVGFNSTLYFSEALIDCVKNLIPRRNTRRFVITFVVCGISFFFGIPFTLSNGYYILEIVDHYVGNYGMGLIALMECLVIGYFSSNPEGGAIKISPLMNNQNGIDHVSSNRLQPNSESSLTLFKFIRKRFSKFSQHKSWNNFKGIICFSVDSFRERIERDTTIGPFLIWSLVVKYLTPLSLFVFLIWNLVTESIHPFSTFKDPSKYDVLSLVLGWLLVLSCLVIFAIFAIWPSVEENEEVGGDDMKEFVSSFSKEDLKQPLNINSGEDSTEALAAAAIDEDQV